MKRALAILAAVFSVTATAAPVPQATHLWTTNKINEIVGTNTAAKIACATNAVLGSAVAASAEMTNAVLAAVQDKYLPTDGGFMTGNLSFFGMDMGIIFYDYNYNCLLHVGPNLDGDLTIFNELTEFESAIIPDGSPVATSNMVERMADVRYAPTSTAVTVASHASQLSRLSQSLDTKIDAPSATNVASATITNHVESGYLCTVAAAEDAYLKKLETAAYAERAEKLTSFRTGFTSPATIGFVENGSAAYVKSEQDAFFRTYKSMLKPDNSPFATSNMVGRMIAAIPVGTDTNAVKDIAASASVTNAGAVAEAAASAAAAYLPLSGGRLTGSLITRDAYIMDDFIYFMDGDENILFWIYANGNGDLTVSNLYGDESAIAPDGSPVATSNMVERMADYALTGGAVLKSGEIAAIETATNLTLRLDFGDNGRGADCAAYVENLAASNVCIAVAPDAFHLLCAGDAPLTLPKTSTNLVHFCRVKTNAVVVSRQEVK